MWVRPVLTLCVKTKEMILTNYKKLVAESQTWFNEKVKLINSVENNMDNHGKKITTG